MLAGFRSRWMTPRSCAASSASAICRAMASASSIGIGPCGDAIGQRRTVDVFEHQQGTRIALLDAVNLRDIRMVERGEHLRFAVEARQPFLIGATAAAAP